MGTRFSIGSMISRVCPRGLSRYLGITIRYGLILLSLGLVLVLIWFLLSSIALGLWILGV